MHLSLIKAHSQHVTMQVHKQGVRPWLLSAVYANPKPQTWDELWAELEDFARSINLPWMLMGDFNETKSLEERDYGGEEMIRRCNKFNNFIENSGLIDLGFTGPKFTWALGKNLAT